MAALEWIDRLPSLPRRSDDAHKGDFGHVLVIAGARGMSGAAILSGSAALRAGAGLVTVACPESVWPIIAAGNPCLMTWPLPDVAGQLDANSFQQIHPRLAAFDVLIIGPGLGRSDSVKALVSHVLAEAKQPAIVDADALYALGCPPDGLHGSPGPRVLTPHVGEMSRLLGIPAADVRRQREKLTGEFAQRFGVTFVLKGHGTLVGDGQRIYRNETGNPGMATAGTGDVLSGVIGGLIGQGLSPFDGARLGVHLHGAAGDLARDALGEVSLTAADLLDYLPSAFQSYAASRTDGR